MENILNLLKQNARLSISQLATMLGCSETNVELTIKNLEDSGIIKGYSVILDEEKANNNSVSAIIELKITPRPDSGFDEIAKTIMRYDEVKSVALMSGAYDLAVTISGQNLREIALFVAQRLSTIDGVLSTATHFVLKRYKEKGIIIGDDETPDERSFVSP